MFALAPSISATALHLLSAPSIEQNVLELEFREIMDRYITAEHGCQDGTRLFPWKRRQKVSLAGVKGFPGVPERDTTVA